MTTFMRGDLSSNAVVVLDPALVMHDCGHEGPASFLLLLAGVPQTLPEEVLARHMACAECVLRETVKGMIACGKCGKPIMVDCDCVLRADGAVWCVRSACGGADGVDGVPGVWDGRRVVPSD